ncbi:hypothetical protein Tco_0515470 [Tanacetum coccineum]
MSWLSPLDVEIVSLEVVEIVIPEVGGIDTNILLTIKDNTLREKLLNVNLLIAKIDALRDNPTPSSDVVIKSTSTFPNLFLEETNTLDNSLFPHPTSMLPRYLEEISMAVLHNSYSFQSYLFLINKAFYDDNGHLKKKRGRSDFHHEEFADELAHIISLPELECFKFKIEPDPGDLTSIAPGIRKNASTTNVNVPLEDDQSSLLRI